MLVGIALLRTKAARPDGKVLRLLLETSTFNDVAASLHSLHQQSVLAASAVQAERNVSAIRDTQDKIEWVEIFLVGVYSVYLIHYLGENFHGYVGWWILGGTLCASSVAWLLLRPRLTKTGRLVAIPVLALIVILLTTYISVGMNKHHNDQKNEGAKKTEGR